MSGNKHLNNKQEEQSKTVFVQSHQMISSPLPPPDWLERYNKISSNIVDDVLEQYRKNGDHFREEGRNDMKIKTKQINIVAISQWHGFIATMSILLCILFCAYFDKKEIALGLLSLSFIGIIQSLIRKK